MSNSENVPIDEPPLPRDGTVDHLPNSELGRFATNVRHWLREEYGCTTEAVYLVGSWARAEAMRRVSDLDVRVVTQEDPGVETGEEMRERLKSKMEWTPEQSTLPDVVVTAVEPSADEPKVRIQ